MNRKLDYKGCRTCSVVGVGFESYFSRISSPEIRIWVVLRCFRARALRDLRDMGRFGGVKGSRTCGAFIFLVSKMDTPYIHTLANVRSRTLSYTPT